MTAMKLTEHIAKHLRGIHFGPNWTGVNLKEKLSDVTWQQATTRVDSFHSIATLVFHMNYYVSATVKVLRGGALDAKDAYSFDHPPVTCREDWEALMEKTLADAEDLAGLIEKLPDSQVWETFVDEKYGNYYRCLHGPIEHGYYHLGQIALIKKRLAQEAEKSS